MSLGLSAKALAVKPSSTLAITARAKELKAQGIDVGTCADAIASERSKGATYKSWTSQGDDHNLW